jgi:hypothetical protein
MRTTLTRALVGLGLAGALFLGAGAAVAQTSGRGQSQPRRLKITYRVRLTSSIRARANG